VAFREAGTVEARDVLYELDDRKFQAAVAAAEAALKKAGAAHAAARITFDRNEKLAATNAVSAQTLDDARSSLLQAEAEEEAAKAELDAARINLDNTIIRAPIGGIIGLSTVSAGALVTANQTQALATIRQIDPVYVDMVDSSANFLRIRDEVEAGRLGRERDAAPAVALTLENGRAYDRKGEMKLADMVVSQTSGTFSLRATFANPDRVLLPGMFVRAGVDLGSMPNAFLVPQRAVQRSANGDPTLYVASGDDKAELRAIATGGAVGNDWIVVDGVADGDRLIVDGFQKISDGAAIRPVEATIDEDGVVRQTISPATDGQGELQR
jgi:membrane fusion protein (multidrug efflux system)